MNRCHNCKFIKYENYSDNSCKALWTLNKSEGIITKEYPKARDVRDSRDDCPHYKHDLVMKIKIKIGAIQGWWYSRKFPEKMI